MLEVMETIRSLCIAGNTADAIVMLRELDAAGAADADTLFMLGALLRESGAVIEAVDILERVTAMRPDMTGALAELGLSLIAIDQLPRALEALRIVNQRVPGHSTCAALAELLVSYASVLLPQERIEEATRILEEAVGVNGTVPGALALLAVARGKAGDFHSALALNEQAAALYPDDRAILSNQSYMLENLNRSQEAEAVARYVLETLDPDMASAWSNLGNALRTQGRLTEAEAAFSRALALDPTLAAPHANMGTQYSLAGDFDRSDQYFRRAIELAPKDAALPFIRACDRLRAGDWENGWALYEERHLYPGRQIGWPGLEHLASWPGGDPAGQRILLECEQGHGDSLHFFRYARLLADRGAQVGLLAQPSLVRLFQVSDPRLTVVEAGWQGDQAHWDYGVPLLSLPHRFGVRPDHILAPAPYLAADPADRAAWAARLAGLTGLKVGLVWAGDPRPHDPTSSGIDQRRSLSLSILAPLGTVPGVEFVNLQMGAPASQLADAPFAIHDWMEGVRDFADTAALVCQLDLVITVDTSVAHLAGGLGVPVMLLSRFDGCWRWLHGRDDTPWYPGMRLFRQRRWGDWGDPIADLRAALADRAGAG